MEEWSCEYCIVNNDILNRILKFSGCRYGCMCYPLSYGSDYSTYKTSIDDYALRFKELVRMGRKQVEEKLKKDDEEKENLY